MAAIHCPFCRVWVQDQVEHFAKCPKRPPVLAGRRPLVSVPVSAEREPSLTEAQQSLGWRIAAKAREYVSTPYFHCGRQKGFGIDCIGLLFCVAHELNITDYDEANYQQDMIDPVHIEEGIARFCDRVELTSITSGDICIMKVQNIPQHTGIYAADKVGQLPTFIHAHQAVGKVVEDTFDRFWRMQLHRVYRVRLNSG